MTPTGRVDDTKGEDSAFLQRSGLPGDMPPLRGGSKKIQKAAVRSFYTPRCTAHLDETKCEVCAHPLVNSMGKVRHTKDTNGVVTRICNKCYEASKPAEEKENKKKKKNG